MKRGTKLKILIDIGHPAHVHFFKYFISNMKEKGHKVLVTARNKDVTLDLLKAYQIDFIPVGAIGNTKLDLITEWMKRDYEIVKIAGKFNPDILMGMLNPCAAHASKLLRKKSVIFNDSEVVASTALITYPFADVICTPMNFSKNLGKKHVRFNGYKELAYLHPNHFKPNPDIFKDLNIDINDKYIVMRFVAWKAGHDVKQRGFDLNTKIKCVRELEKYGRVFISSEDKLPKELEDYRIKFPPEKMHSLLYYAQMLIGDSQTMTTEAAVLGTPAIRYNTFVGEKDMSNFIELEKKYVLIHSYDDPDKAINKAIQLIQRPNLKEEWKGKREMLLKDKIDVTEFMIWFIENYPKSLEKIRENEILG